MSNIGKILSYAAGYVLVVFVVGIAILALLAGILGWLVPIATAGAVQVGFVQAVAITVLGLIARVVLIGR